MQPYERYRHHQMPNVKSVDEENIFNCQPQKPDGKLYFHQSSLIRFNCLFNKRILSGYENMHNVKIGYF